ncbi:uncharacterized protein LOC110102033 [Dendrobium catenatum]|uniref:Uncharacterized protein n=1 Tax=Dendrobium catenatum TaxID=906689 RepID=A0A2I0W9J8_9ASPA|nr:uncharacterized protein LOC110102033 [Dendrobium catenatum]XP_028553723.1 uncharacterized protein LOC110102033 [Dendrobium catenatum]PKU72336.1 hypothetical protein MA16_Dca006336 [Dendrobium catenatum]
MSGGTPVGTVRQRCNQGYASSGDDLEDDACSRLTISSSSSLLVVRRTQSWVDVLENIIWLVSATFIFYYGDRRRNFLRVLWSDLRINRKALHLGLVVIVMDICLIMYAVLQAKVSKKPYDKNEALRAIAPLVILLGLASFCLLSYGLWPIWGLLTIPLLFTLLMASMVVLTYLLFGRQRSQSATTRTD